MAPRKAASPSVSAASEGDTVMAKAVSSAGTASTSMADESVSQLASSIAAMSVTPSDPSSPARNKAAEGVADSFAVAGTPLRNAKSPAAAPASPQTPGAVPVTSPLGDDHGAFVLCHPAADAEDFDCRATLSLPASNGHLPLDLVCKLHADFAQTLQLLFTPDDEAQYPRGQGPARVGDLPARKLGYSFGLPLGHVDSWACETPGVFALALRTDRPGLQPYPGGKLPSDIAARLSTLPASAPAFPQSFLEAPVLRLRVDNKSSVKGKSPGEEGATSTASRLKAALAAALVPNDFHRAYRVRKYIDQGAEGYVYQAERRDNGSLVAVKVPLESYKSLEHEAKMLRAAAGSPYVMQCLDFLRLQEGSALREYLILEWMGGGSLVKYIVERENAGKPLCEDEVRGSAACMLRGLRDMHAANVPHRDFKPDNCLLAAAGDLRSVKLADLGHAKVALESPSLRTFSISGKGTPLYNAPERVDADGTGYTVAADVWSLGVTLFAMLTCKFPFGSLDAPAQTTANAILKSSWRPLPGSAAAVRLGACSAECMDLMDAMLRKDPAKRITVAAALAHPWLASEPEAKK